MSERQQSWMDEPCSARTAGSWSSATTRSRGHRRHRLAVGRDSPRRVGRRRRPRPVPSAGRRRGPVRPRRPGRPGGAARALASRRLRRDDGEPPPGAGLIDELVAEGVDVAAARAGGPRPRRQGPRRDRAVGGGRDRRRVLRPPRRRDARLSVGSRGTTWRGLPCRASSREPASDVADAVAAIGPVQSQTARSPSSASPPASPAPRARRSGGIRRRRDRARQHHPGTVHTATPGSTPPSAPPPGSGSAPCGNGC